MKVALGVPQVRLNRQDNLSGLMQMTEDAADVNAEMIVFSEAAITGFVNTGDPDYDLSLGQSIPGVASEALCQLAARCRIWVATGFFERVEDRLFGTAILIGPDGVIHMRYRRIDPRWHHWHNRPCPFPIYAMGDEVPIASTPIGTAAFLLCGDLFNNTCFSRLKALNPDWLLYPMARGFDEDVADTAMWHRQEKYLYARRAREAGVNMMLVNQLTDDEMGGFFGAALFVSRSGEILGEFPLKEEGMLLIDIPECTQQHARRGASGPQHGIVPPAPGEPRCT